MTSAGLREFSTAISFTPWRRALGLIMINRLFQRTATLKTGPHSAKFNLSLPLTKEWVSQRLGKKLAHESPVILEMIALAAPDSCVLDIGAYIGFYSLFLAINTPVTSIHAFELSAKAAAELEQNCVLNNAQNVWILNAAAWNEDGDIITFAPHIEANPTTNSVTTSRSQSGGASQAVTISIDSYCASHGITPTLAKIDVEGAEFKVLEGMRRTLGSLEHLFIEMHPDLWSPETDPVAILADLLDPNDYDMSYFELHRSQNPRRIGISQLTEIPQIPPQSMLQLSRRKK